MADLTLISNVIKQASAEKLFSLLNSIDGKKDLVLDRELIYSLDYIANFSQLKTCKVEKIFKLEPGSAPGTNEKCVYLVKPSIEVAKIIADHINACKSAGKPKKFCIINIPRKLHSSDLVLEREGVYGYITHLELPLGFLSLDKDIFSLEIPDFFNAFFLKGDLTHVHTAALALVQLCKICGPIPKLFGQGKCAKMVTDLMSTIFDEINLSPAITNPISHLVIVDRDIDFVSVLLSQLTYEGMLDDFFGINSGRIIFPKAVTGKEEPLKVVLNSSDIVFDEIRNKSFASVFAFLRDKAKELQAKKSKKETSSMSVEAMKHFVSTELKSIQKQETSLSLHVGACEVIVTAKNGENFQERLRVEHDIIENQNLKDCLTYTEDVICRQDSYQSALKLMCLLSISQDGLLSADYESLFTLFRQSYGCQHTSTLYNLKKIGLFTEQPALLTAPSKSSRISEVASVQATKIAEKVASAVSYSKNTSFKAITRKFNLIPVGNENLNLKNPTDMSYVFGGSYVPLIGRITEQVIQHNSLKNIEDGMKLLPGSTIMKFKTDKVLDTSHVIPTNDISSKTVLVYVLGGITYAEVAALRLLGRLNGCLVLIATTSLISGGSLMKMLSPEA